MSSNRCPPPTLQSSFFTCIFCQKDFFDYKPENYCLKCRGIEDDKNDMSSIKVSSENKVQTTFETTITNYGHIIHDKTLLQLKKEIKKGHIRQMVSLICNDDI